jgi:restriction system protein
MSTELSATRKLGASLMFAAMNILKEKGGQLSGREVIAEIEKRLTLSDWAKETYEKSGYTRWKSILHFFSIDLIKAQFLVKKKGVWYITQEGEEAIKLGERGLLDASLEAYRKWRDETPKSPKEKVIEVEDISTDEGQLENQQQQEATLQQMEELANEGLKQRINSLNPYEFQDLVAALLRAMGYFTPFVAPKGKDGGVDVIAYQDPLGVKSPRIKVQVKHRESSASVDELRQLMGLLQRDGDVGIFVSSGGFTSDSKTTARSSQVHVELIDLDRLIVLWQEFYGKLDDEDRNLLRLKPIYFYEPL